MNHILYALIFIFAPVLTFLSCSKSSNNYSNADHTKGMVKLRSWTGYSDGFVKGDTVKHPPDSIAWAKHYHNTIADTSFSVDKINGYSIRVAEAVLAYRATDSTAGYVYFDSTYSGSGTSKLFFFYAKDSMSYEFHLITGYCDSAAEYYQANKWLHTK